MPQLPRRDATVLFSWRAGDISADRFAVWQQQSLRQTRGHRVFKFGSQRLLVPYRHLSPVINRQGQIVAQVKNDSADPHCDFRPHARSLEHGFYTELDSTYAVNVEFEIRDTAMPWIAGDDAWAIAIQFWGPRYEGFHQRKNPPFALMVFRGMWRIQQYGCARETSKNFPIDASSNLFPVTAGRHQWKLKYRPSLHDGETTAYWNGDLVYHYQGVNAVHGRVGGKMLGPGMLFGCYADRDAAHPTPAEIVYHSIVYRRLT